MVVAVREVIGRAATAWREALLHLLSFISIHQRQQQQNPSRPPFSIESDVYGLYGNLINVRGLEDEGRFVDPLYDALRRSDPELNALDAKIIDSKISASSDESVGLGSRSSQQTTDSNAPTAIVGNNISPLPPNGEVGDGGSNADAGKKHSITTAGIMPTLPPQRKQCQGKSTKVSYGVFFPSICIRTSITHLTFGGSGEILFQLWPSRSILNPLFVDYFSSQVLRFIGGRRDFRVYDQFDKSRRRVDSSAFSVFYIYAYLILHLGRISSGHCVLECIIQGDPQSAHFPILQPSFEGNIIFGALLRRTTRVLLLYAVDGDEAEGDGSNALSMLLQLDLSLPALPYYIYMTTYSG
ncbi:hypothetical protein Ocin01_17431 [Orchesella cincta]|uniref:Uncharacterized protein n=1 Tax=Orchesella cincta TaxID=48709 RepID=A0A1D2M8J2_ORCCI|nr:hypothetical protein Ocin01_17431 [Orchesella cincta]